ncbi:MAG: phage late control D family protein [Candidatus Hodarchaeota archaeon]
MENEICLIKINDEEHPDLYPDIVSVEAEEDERLASVFNIRLAIRLPRDGTWTWIDDERLSPWKKVSISAGFADNVVEVITGYITQVKPYFDSELSRSYLDVKGMDGSVLMSTEEKLKDWPNKKDSDIATQIFTDYGFTPEVEDTGVVHDEAISTIIQKETDIQFLKRLARRNEFECFVRNTTGYFRPPQLNGVPQRILAVQFGTESNLAYFKVELNALQPTIVEMHQLDLLTKESRDVTVDSTQQCQLGLTSASDLYSAEIRPAKVFVKHTKVIGQPAMQALCQGLYDDAEWLVQGEGEIVGSLYQDVLKARELVTIKGVGKIYSGVYYVIKVKHVFTDSGYTQRFNVKRNALNPDGSEDFGAGGSLVRGLV